MQLDRMTLGRMAREMGFVRDTLEKFCRLADVLKFMEDDPLLSTSIALKGGTAINLTIFDLPRLSGDLDLDSFVYEYVNAGGVKDNLKIEINYMLRAHVLLVRNERRAESWMPVKK